LLQNCSSSLCLKPASFLFLGPNFNSVIVFIFQFKSVNQITKRKVTLQLIF
jgi:hypothetical protein